MGNIHIKKVGFEDIQQFNQEDGILINTLRENDQHVLIQKTVSADHEIMMVKKAIKHNKKIIIYGYNNNDESIFKKYKQILDLGHKNVYVYIGGLFEWLLLNDIYGNELFPVTNPTNDFLIYRPKTTYLLEN
jgi:3-mercaptopyruvate sulfurtransferase SseA